MTDDSRKDILITNPRTKEGRIAITKMLMRLFDHWELSPKDQLAILGLSEKSSTSLARYRRGEPIADRRDLLDRAGDLLYIHKALRILFPRNRDIVYSWISTPNRAFGGEKPIDVIRKDGVPGLLLVKQYLDSALRDDGA